ncbi:MAG TPA: V-type ATP synthase subunit A, partial [Candidatus Omnitrophota bacterium]|nr:V-type ATP synthase subunit A [Candidatus Omnitrophota bacterium]
MSQPRTGKVVKVNGNMVTVAADATIIQNEVAYIKHAAESLKAEVIRVRGNRAETQVYESTAGLVIGDEVEFTGELLSVELGPGLLGQIFDGLQNPLPHLAEQHGFFLKRGAYLDALPHEAIWEFTPFAAEGDTVRAGDKLGIVPEKMFKHYIMVPFSFQGAWEVVRIADFGRYDLKTPIARLRNQAGREFDVYMKQRWPVKIAISAFSEKLKPIKPLVTKMRIIDSLFPVARGGTYCLPAPFAAGKTVLQQLVSRHADADVV